MDDTALSPKNSLRKTRRIACDVCRDRKVRCDRRQPSCERCIRLGNRCTYTVMTMQSSTASNGSSARIHKLLLQMQSRLARAEIQLAKSQPTASYQMPETTMVTSPYLSDGSGNSETFDTEGTIWDQWRRSSDFLDLDESLGMSAVDLSSVNMGNMDELSIWSIPTVRENAQEPEVGDPTIRRFVLYFEHMHPMLPMLNRARFEATLDAVNISTELIALKYAVLMSGAATHSSSVDTAEHYYVLARRSLEQAEQKDTNERFFTVSALQALILIVVYEFKKKSLARAWMTIGRCIRLTRALDLQHIDSERELGDRKISILEDIKITPTSDPTELEERRNTFWCAYIIDWYVSVLTGCPPTFNSQSITCFLPRRTYIETLRSFDARDRLQDAIADTRNVSDTCPFRGFAIMAALAARVSTHCSASLKTNPPNDNAYPFWSEHFKLAESISTTSNALLSHNSHPSQAPDVRFMLLALNTYAIEILLQDLAITRSEWEKVVPASVVQESRHRSAHAAKAIIAMLQRLQTLDFKSKLVIKQMNTFNMWSLSLAAKVTLRMLNSPQDPAATHDALSDLHVLHTGITELEDESVFFRTLLDDVAANLAVYGGRDVVLGF